MGASSWPASEAAPRRQDNHAAGALAAPSTGRQKLRRMDIVIRESRVSDIPAIAGIYGHWVSHGLASFEYESPEEAEMAKRREAVLDGGYPYLYPSQQVLTLASPVR
jgi:hypothetical protein